MKYIGVIDYGMGNLRSVQKALESVGAKARVINTARDVRAAAALVLPGVGAFGQAAARLRATGLFAPLGEALTKQKPFMGICLGLQLLFERSEESPSAKGFGYVKGSVVRFKRFPVLSLKVPHMGWNTIDTQGSKVPALRGIAAGDYFYFVHSYFPVPKEPHWTVAKTQYGQDFCAAIAARNLFACQFHPEKSGKKGLRILKNFTQMAA